MKTVKLKKMTLVNFKNWANSTFDFENISELRGETGSGKSSYFEAWKWILGFNATDIEPLGEGKIQIADLETRVEAIVEIDGLEYILARKSNQKWKTNKETQTRSFDGNETTFYIDNIELKANVFKDKIADLFGVDYSNLEMLISLPYFNSTSAKWTWRERRQILYTLCGVDNIVKQLFDKECYNLVANDLKKGYSTVEITKSINNEKKFINEGKTRNETLITAKSDELSKYSNYNYDTIQAEITKAEKQLENLIALNNKATKNTLVAEKLAEIEKLTAQLSKLQIANSKALQEKNTELAKLNGQLNNIKVQGSADKAELEQLEKTIARYEEIIAVKVAETYNNDNRCPSCKQLLPAEQIKTMQTTFEQLKSKQLVELRTSLSDATARRELLIKNIEAQRTLYGELKIVYDEMREMELDDSEIIKLEETISELRNETQKLKMAEVNAEKEEKIAELKAKITELKGQYAYKTVADNIRIEIERLREDSKNLTNREIANEKKRKQLEEYIAETISKIDNEINNKFNGIRFRLFNPLTSGAMKEFEEDCSAEYLGIDYQNLSDGQKIYCNYLIQLDLQKLFNVSFPIIIDNMQNLTLDLNCEQQLIKLITTKTSKNLNGVKISDVYKK